MKAAVVRDFDHTPAYGDFERPSPGADDVLIQVSAAALSNLVKAQAAGKHYSSPARAGFVPGVDGVGRMPDGQRVYFAFPKAPFGAMAETTAVARSLCVPVPDELDDVTAAAAGNPGMSSWAALTERAGFVAGESVLINGATGVSGRLAVQIARHLGARRVVATGRNATSRASLLALGADAHIALDQPADALVSAFQDELNGGGIDVVLDYLWGPSGEQIIRAVSKRGHESAARRVRFVQIGSVTSQTITLPGDALRSCGLELLGSGIGSVPAERLVRAIGAMMKAIRPAHMTIDAEPIPLTNVESGWTLRTPKRVVFTI